MGALNKSYTLLKVISVSGCERVHLHNTEWKGGVGRGGEGKEGEAEKTTHPHPFQSKGTAEFPWVPC